jgi:hypothetical protein
MMLHRLALAGWSARNLYSSGLFIQMLRMSLTPKLVAWVLRCLTLRAFALRGLVFPGTSRSAKLLDQRRNIQ